MRDPIRRIVHPKDVRADAAEPMPRREWLVTNGLGGYASMTVAGVVTRRYHGLLVSALPAPLGRYVMLNHLLERVRLPNRDVSWLGDELEVAGPNVADERDHLVEFRLELGLPVWVYVIEDVRIEKRLVMPYGQNTVHVTYRLLDGAGPVRLALRPSVHFRPYEAPVNAPALETYKLTAVRNRYELSGGEDLPSLKLSLRGESAALTLDEKGISAVPYQMEKNRGYPYVGSLWSPGYFRSDLMPSQPVTLVASTESWETIDALGPEAAEAAEIERRRRLLAIASPIASEEFAAELVLAADQFIVTPAGRAEEAARARAAGGEVRTVIAGYHWFTDWGRDTMISLEGLTLCTHRFREAAYILRTFAHYVRDGLIPNMFPDGSREGLYHTADATLWFFHAVERFVRATGDNETLRLLLPTLITIVELHVRGTRFGIGVDPDDGLLRQGAEGYQLTWMDAKVDEWVVTPRRGKAVEINALWYNALRLLDTWTRGQGLNPGLDLSQEAARVQRSFNDRFWYADGGYLFDVVDGESGDDAACRPNQIFSVSLDHPVLDPSRWESVVATVRERLLTPVGLRSLAPGHPDYKPRYFGDLRSRDAAYHQGTVWGWLIGPYVDAWLRLHPDRHQEARALVGGFEAHLNAACIGSISEIADAEPPFVPRGCVAQAWSVAEVLRVLDRTRPASGRGPLIAATNVCWGLMDLTALGWNRTLAEAFQPYAAEGLLPARVALEHTHIYRVITEEGEWLARVSGRLRHQAGSRIDFPAVGDWVAVERAAQGGDARIRGVLPRFSRFSRRAAGDPTEEQIVASNVDTVFIVGGLDGDFNPRRIERYLAVAWESGATPVVVLNKADLVEDPEQKVEEVARLAPAVPVYAVSCRAPESLAVLHSHLRYGKTGALLGSSGVGKSTIVNQLIGRELLPTRDVRAWDSRGRHTSTARQLVLLPAGGVLIDTPGMRELQLWDTGEALSGVFADIDRFADGCRFRDCSHVREPGCAVRAAVDAGELPAERLASYQKLRDEQAFQSRQQDQRALIEEKSKARIGSKALHKRLKDKGRT